MKTALYAPIIIFNIQRTNETYQINEYHKQRL